MQRPSLRPMPHLRAACKITDSLAGNTFPSARSRAILKLGHSATMTHSNISSRRCGVYLAAARRLDPECARDGSFIASSTPHYPKPWAASVTFASLLSSARHCVVCAGAPGMPCHSAFRSDRKLDRSNFATETIVRFPISVSSVRSPTFIFRGIRVCRPLFGKKNRGKPAISAEAWTCAATPGTSPLIGQLMWMNPKGFGLLKCIDILAFPFSNASRTALGTSSDKKMLGNLPSIADSITSSSASPKVPPFQVRSATSQHRRHGGVKGGGKGWGQGL
jgi:hypothetical protein